jgi:hypothetical protein
MAARDETVDGLGLGHGLLRTPRPEERQRRVSKDVPGGAQTGGDPAVVAMSEATDAAIQESRGALRSLDRRACGAPHDDAGAQIHRTRAHVS